MATIKHYKVVAALPSTLVADSIYLVRVGTGFDLYVTNSSGTIVAYPANYQAGSANLSALSGLSGAANKAPYFTAAGAMAVYDLTVFGRSFAAAADQAAGRTLLGLGTAATRAATTSPTDTTSERLWRTNDLVKQTGTTDDTAGRVMLTGAGGLLGTAEDLGSGFDWNNLGGRSRLVRGILNSTVNGPFTDAYWLMGAYIALDSSGNNAVFHGSVVTNATVRHFTRSKTGGTWYSWVEEWHSGNFDPNSKANVADPSFTGNVTIGNAFQANAGSMGIEVGRTDGIAGTGYVDFHCGATAVDYDARIAAINGVGANGGGLLVIIASSVAISGALIVGGNALDNTDSGWLTPTLVNSYAQGTDPVRYRRIGKFVVVTGSLRRSSPPTALQTICTLPAGYRPTKPSSIAVFWISDNLDLQATNIAIGTDGEIATGLIYPRAGTPSGAGGTSFTLIFPVD